MATTINQVMRQKKNKKLSHLDPLRRDVRFLTTILGDVMVELEGRSFFEKVEKARMLAKEIRRRHTPDLAKKQRTMINALSADEAYKMARAFTIYFQLVNMAEERHRVRRIRSKEHDGHGKQEMSLRKLLYDLKARKIRPKRVLDFLNKAEIELVLTAHPTETKRRTVLDHLLHIARALASLDSSDLTRWERDMQVLQIRETVEALWQTSEIRAKKVGVLDEVHQTLFYMTQTILPLAPSMHAKTAMEFERAYPGVPFRARPFIRFGSWVGGDRDGNPNVTPEISHQAVELKRRAVLERYLSKTSDFIRDFSQSRQLVNVSSALMRSLKRDEQCFPVLAKTLAKFDEDEPYRRKFSYMHERLKRTLERKPNGYGAARVFEEDLALIQKSLRAHRGIYAATGALDRFMNEIRIFGFHLAPLEFRDHSSKIRIAAREFLGKEPDESDLIKAIKSGKLYKRQGDFSSATRDILAQLDMLRTLTKQNPDGAGNYLISLTESVSDVLSLIFLAAQRGLIRVSLGRVRESALSVVPLFETVQSLREAPAILERLFSIGLYRSLLKARGNYQEIMFGYSDSNKNGGYLAANWELYLAQKLIGQMDGRRGIKVKLFHGKGGTIDRGGGASHRALLAQPYAATGGRIKITEQGEVISQKYSNFMIAKRNLEQLVTAVVWTNLVSRKELVGDKKIPRWEARMETLSEVSCRFYRDLIMAEEGFVDFYEQATPIQIVSMAKFSSRPPKRRQSGSVEDLRAIPWVFSWIQSRYMVSSWYGFGYACEVFAGENSHDGLSVLREMYDHWPFFRSLVDNIQASLAKTDLYIAEVYASLVQERELRERITQKLRNEHKRTVHWVLSIARQDKLLQKAPVLSESIRLRNPYVDPLHFIQVEYLKKLRHPSFDRGTSEMKRKISNVLLLTVNGISFGMKSTG